MGSRAPLLPGFGIQGDYGLCDFDIPKFFHLSGAYDIPFGHGRQFLNNSHGVVDALFGGWSTNWILTLQDGQPGTVPCAITTTSGFGCYALLVPGQSVTAGPHNVNQWLNPAAFASPPVATTVGQSDYSPLAARRLSIMVRDFTGSTSPCSRTSTYRENLPPVPGRILQSDEYSKLLPAWLSRQRCCRRPRRADYTSPANFGKITSTRDGQNDQREIQFALKLYF